MKLNTVLAACALVLAVPAHAAVITKSFSFTGRNFALVYGEDFVAPIDPVYVTGSITFDNAMDYSNETSGLVFTSNLPYPVQFGYDSSSDNLTLATFAQRNSCSTQQNSFCVVIRDFATAVDPLPSFFQQVTPAGGFYNAQTITAGVPEPATWALLTIGFGAIGVAMRRRQAPRIAYA